MAFVELFVGKVIVNVFVAVLSAPKLNTATAAPVHRRDARRVCLPWSALVENLAAVRLATMTIVLLGRLYETRGQPFAPTVEQRGVAHQLPRAQCRDRSTRAHRAL